MGRTVDRLRAFGLGAAGGVAVIAAVVLIVASQARDDVGPPEEVPRGLVLGFLIGVPALIGLMGVRRRDPVLLVAAAGASLAPVPLSIITIPLVIPAILFLVAAAAGVPPRRRATWLVALAIVGLQVGAFVGLLGNTEGKCWVAYPSDHGLVYRTVAGTENTSQVMGGPGQPVASGCDGGALTVRGAALAAVLSVGAVALAFGAPKPRPATV